MIDNLFFNKLSNYVKVTIVNRIKSSAVNSNSGQINPGLSEELSKEAEKEFRRSQDHRHKPASGVCVEFQRLDKSWVKSYYLPASNALNFASSMTGTPISCALANLDPGSLPTKT